MRFLNGQEAFPLTTAAQNMRALCFSESMELHRVSLRFEFMVVRLVTEGDTLLCEAQHNSVYLIMVVMRRTDVKTAPGGDSWRRCFT